MAAKPATPKHNSKPIKYSILPSSQSQQTLTLPLVESRCTPGMLMHCHVQQAERDERERNGGSLRGQYFGVDPMREHSQSSSVEALWLDPAEGETAGFLGGFQILSEFDLVFLRHAHEADAIA